MMRPFVRLGVVMSAHRGRPFRRGEVVRRTWARPNAELMFTSRGIARIGQRSDLDPHAPGDDGAVNQFGVTSPGGTRTRPSSGTSSRSIFCSTATLTCSRSVTAIPTARRSRRRSGPSRPEKTPPARHELCEQVRTRSSRCAWRCVSRAWRPAEQVLDSSTGAGIRPDGCGPPDRTPARPRAHVPVEPDGQTGRSRRSRPPRGPPVRDHQAGAGHHAPDVQSRIPLLTPRRRRNHLLLTIRFFAMRSACHMSPRSASNFSPHRARFEDNPSATRRAASLWRR